MARSWAVSMIGRRPSVGCTPENRRGLLTPTVQLVPATALPHSFATAMWPTSEETDPLIPDGFDNMERLGGGSLDAA